MKDCCEVTADYTARQRRVLRVVLWINIVMFMVEATAGLLAHSTALFADSVDMLGDAIVYGFSLYVISRGLFWQARAALLKGVRGQKPADLSAIVDVLRKFSQLCLDLRGVVQEIDINPLLVLDAGQGAKAVDCLVVPAKEGILQPNS